MGSGGGQVSMPLSRRKEYQRRKHDGTSNVTHKQALLTKSYQSVPPSSTPGLPHLLQGQTQEIRRSCHALQWQDRGLHGYHSNDVAVDVFEKTSSTEQSYNVSAVKNIHAAARSVFILERYPLIHPEPIPPTVSRTTRSTTGSRSRSV